MMVPVLAPDQVCTARLLLPFGFCKSASCFSRVEVLDVREGKRHTPKA